ncbi:MAG: LysR family transcriptional regulator [Lachnospiraceae bacterium]|nr:LysR family transcriptional regulator [Lachnospiraceae bacterium]
MELLQLRYFKDAAESENFSSVAKKHFVPQPSISKTIKKLEEELGVSLFDRNGKKITLNGNGKYFYEKVNSALELIDEGAGHFSNAKSTIMLYTQAGSRFVSLLTADYLLSHRNVYISFVNYSSNLENKYDFTIMQPLSDMSQYEYVELMKDEIVAIVSNNHPLALSEKLSIKDLSSQSYIAYYKSMNLRDFTDNFCMNSGGFTPVVSYETHDYTTLRYLVEKNKGIALLPKAFFDLQPSLTIKAIPLKEKTYRHLVLAWNKSKKLNTVEKEFVEYAKQWFSTL